MFRASMMRTAEKIAKERKALAIVTGEALSQVASQTLEAMSFTDSMTDTLVIRPLVGMDKEEIISTAKEIGTYETSILPYEDCCVIFSPKHPVTHPDKEESRKHYLSLEMDEEIDKAIANTEVFYFNPVSMIGSTPRVDSFQALEANLEGSALTGIRQFSGIGFADGTWPKKARRFKDDGNFEDVTVSLEQALKCA